MNRSLVAYAFRPSSSVLTTLVCHVGESYHTTHEAYLSLVRCETMLRMTHEDDELKHARRIVFIQARCVDKLWNSEPLPTRLCGAR